MNISPDSIIMQGRKIRFLLERGFDKSAVKEMVQLLADGRGESGEME